MAALLDFAAPFSLAVDNSGLEHLMYKDLPFIREAYPDNATQGVPKYYSLFDNDSIIIADRIRELLVAKQSTPTDDINDQAVIATFSRTMVTSGTTLLTVSALWIMGGNALEGFSIAMFIGILSGTWSSISIGTVLPEWLKLEPKHYLPVEIDSAP